MTAPAEHKLVARRGRRASRGVLTVHALAGPQVGPARAGLVVGTTVGNSVVRHRLSRQLRHLLEPRLAAVTDGTLIVVRALPGAAGASSVTLGTDLDAALAKVLA